MTSVREYIMSVAAMALICGIACGLLKNCCIYAPVKLVCGIMMAVVIVEPFSGIQDFEFPDTVFPESQFGEEAAQDGIDITTDALSKVIKENTCTYILNKARELGIDIQVTVGLNENMPPAPSSVIITGKISPYDRVRLESWIEENLNISKEDQQWSG